MARSGGSDAVHDCVRWTLFIVFSVKNLIAADFLIQIYTIAQSLKPAGTDAVRSWPESNRNRAKSRPRCILASRRLGWIQTIIRSDFDWIPT